MSPCPGFSWGAPTRPRLPTRVIEPTVCHATVHPRHSHSPAAIHHKVPRVDYGRFEDFTREALSSGL